MRACKPKELTGNIHSFETFGTQEGPGIRFVIFFQGCLARCLYCQNPDTWEESSGRKVSLKEIIAKLDKCLPYISSSKGGVTVSGGEPFLQIDFLLEFLRACKKKKIHTCVDTSAFYRPKDKAKILKLLPLVDLFIVDIKASEEKAHKKITSKELCQTLGFIRLLEKNKKNYWLRYVLVPGLNDSEKDLKGLKELVRSFGYCSKLEFLPYHTLGRHKWEHLGLKYPLKNTRPAGAQDISRASRMIRL